MMHVVEFRLLLLIVALGVVRSGEDPIRLSLVGKLCQSQESCYPDTLLSKNLHCTTKLLLQTGTNYYCYQYTILSKKLTWHLDILSCSTAELSNLCCVVVESLQIQLQL